MKTIYLLALCFVSGLGPLQAQTERRYYAKPNGVAQNERVAPEDSENVRIDNFLLQFKLLRRSEVYKLDSQKLEVLGTGFRAYRVVAETGAMEEGVSRGTLDCTLLFSKRDAFLLPVGGMRGEFADLLRGLKIRASANNVDAIAAAFGEIYSVKVTATKGQQELVLRVEGKSLEHVFKLNETDEMQSAALRKRGE